MWERLSRADIEETKQQLNNRREETLRRHAEELTVLESEQAEIVRLDQLINDFVEKFKIAATSSPKPVVSEERELSVGDLSGVSAAPSIPLFITQLQKSELRKLGIAEERIRNMKPQEAHRILGLAVEPTADGEPFFDIASRQKGERVVLSPTSRQPMVETPHSCNELRIARWLYAQRCRGCVPSPCPQSPSRRGRHLRGIRHPSCTA